MSKIKKYIEVDGKFYKLVKNPNGKNCDGCPFVQNERCVGGCDIDYYYQPVEIKPTKETLKKVFNISKRCPMGDIEEDGEYHSYLDFDSFCEYILKHWNDEKETVNQNSE